MNRSTLNLLIDQAECMMADLRAKHTDAEGRYWGPEATELIERADVFLAEHGVVVKSHETSTETFLVHDAIGIGLLEEHVPLDQCKDLDARQEAIKKAICLFVARYGVEPRSKTRIKVRFIVDESNIVD